MGTVSQASNHSAGGFRLDIDHVSSAMAHTWQLKVLEQGMHCARFDRYQGLVLR